MNLTEFEIMYASKKFRESIDIVCNKCNLPKHIQKHKAIENIRKNGKYICQKCKTLVTNKDRVYTPEGLASLAKAMSYKRSDETKSRMSESRKAFFKTPAGIEAKKKLSILTAKGHSENKYENAKRQGWFPSVKTGNWHFYGSSYELRHCWLLDQIDNVESYETQVYFETDNGARSIDCIITFKDNSPKMVVEVKPYKRLTEQKVIEQIEDSQNYAKTHNYDFKIVTEQELGMTYDQLRNWADEIRTKLTGIDFVEHRKRVIKKKAKKHYDTKIATNKVTTFCQYCNCEHDVLVINYDKNMARNGRYICEKEGGHIAGSKPKKKKVNPYAAEGKKQCTKCSAIKLFEEFGVDKSRSDGYASRCLKCRAEISILKYKG